MRHLWVRVFLAMMVANGLAISGVVLTYQAEFERHHAQREARDAAALSQFAAAAEAVLESEGAQAASAWLADLSQRTGIQLALLDGAGHVLTGIVDADAISAARALPSSALEDGREALPVPGYRAVRRPGGGLAVGVARGPGDVLGLSPPTMQLMLVGLLSAAVAIALAWWIGGPLQTLRRATRELLAGPAAVRVVPALSAFTDAEVKALAKDFDRMAERVEALHAARERLLRDLSHELRSPLARLTVALELAREAAGTEAQDHLDRIEKEVERLNELIGLVLTMAKLSQATCIANATPVPLDALVDEICRDAKFEAGKRIGRVALRAAPLSVLGNEEILRQAVENVVRNAARWTAPGSDVEVTVFTEVAAQGMEQAVIEVRDHGPGVPEDALEDIFQPFTRLQVARERSAGGAGIGLAITARALQLHGGVATASNAEAGGLRIRLSLPVSGPVRG